MSKIIVVYSIHTKLDGFKIISELFPKESEYILLSPHKIFPNEKDIIFNYLPKSEFICFSDLLTDQDMENCDSLADTEDVLNQMSYYDRIKVIKNELIIQKLNNKIQYEKGIILNDDLGINLESWLNAGFQFIEVPKFYKAPEYKINVGLIDKLQSKIKAILSCFDKDAYVTKWNGKKYVFYGRLNRISYRLNVRFEKSKIEKFLRGIEKIYIKTINKNGFNRNITRLTTFHEYSPIGKHTPLSIMQDGYLPPNYTSRYMKYFEGQIRFLTWDKMGLKTFINQNLPANIIPFRNKLFIPSPKFPDKLKKILCVSSGAGDWTALKNRSDEDKMVLAFAKIAKKYPEIEFIYRCHPVWVIPQHQGVNSIQRVIDFYDSLGLPNLHVSSNIPCAYQDGRYVLSYQRSSLDDDLKGVDLVFGEHSISMLDGAFKGIIFGSVNLTGRRDYFASFTEMGFPHCETEEEISEIIENIYSENFKNKYLKAVDRYNQMVQTD